MNVSDYYKMINGGVEFTKEEKEELQNVIEVMNHYGYYTKEEFKKACDTLDTILENAKRRLYS